MKSRSLAAKLVSGGHVRVNGVRQAKPAVLVGAGDVLTFPQGRIIRVVRIEALARRRGPAPEAQALYHDMTPPETTGNSAASRVGPRPTKKDRRDMDALRNET